MAHVQWKLADWGPRSGGLPRLEVLRRTLRVPLVVTMHDVFPPTGRLAGRLSPAALGLRRLGATAAQLVVHSEDERARLTGFVPGSRLAVVPHFVEVREHLPDREAARRALGVTDRRVVTLLGYLTKRRGHRLVIDALPLLPPDVTALFVGSVIEGRDHVARELREHAAALGVGERVRFLGYLPEAELEQVLVATDVALCPFRFMSASGALATWISAARPIVASDLAPVRELDALSPGALRRFAPYAPAALASVDPRRARRSHGRVGPASTGPGHTAVHASHPGPLLGAVPDRGGLGAGWQLRGSQAARGSRPASTTAGRCGPPREGGPRPS